MPCFNEEKYLQRKLFELTNCRLPPRYIVICDDGSTDNSVQIIQLFKSANIRLIRHESNQGIHRALATLLSIRPRTEYFVITTPSDSFHCRYFEVVSDLASKYKKPHSIFTATSCSSLDVLATADLDFFGDKIQVLGPHGESYIKYFIRNGLKFPPTLSFAYHKSLLPLAHKVLTNNRLNAFIDICFLAELFSLPSTVIFVGYPLAVQDVNPVSHGKMIVSSTSSWYPLLYFCNCFFVGRIGFVQLLILLKYVVHRRWTKFFSWGLAITA
jgi:glycosyltransferase involved in cell wall biosynthesis